MTIIERVKGAFLGQGIGDALGVPVEFRSREYLRDNPVTDYLEYMCWNQPAGTFSDDSSMMYCTAESLCDGYNLVNIADNFIRWYKEGYWGAHGEIFDIGGTTKNSLDRVFAGEDPKYSGDFFPENNGNGSLMRILPLGFYLAREEDIEVRYELVKEVSSITHAHFRSCFACFIFVELLIQIIKGKNKFDAYTEMQVIVQEYTKKKSYNPTELLLFKRVLNASISELAEAEINSQGYVLDSLESSIWCFLTTNTFSESVLKSVNLGGDTDTTAAINGAIAGLYYGFSQLPTNWINQLAKSNQILELSNRFLESVKI